MYQILTSGNLLKSSCDVEFETISEIFLNLIKVRWSVLYFEWIFFFKSMHGSITLCVGHLGNTGSLSYAELPNIDILH